MSEGVSERRCERRWRLRAQEVTKVGLMVRREVQNFILV
jgi:hypothetical protein